MERIPFIFEETNEEIIFVVLGSVNHNEIAYLMVVDEEEIDSDDMTAYILKATEIDGDDIIYDLVDDDNELEEISEKFEELLDNYEIDFEIEED